MKRKGIVFIMCLMVSTASVAGCGSERGKQADIQTTQKNEQRNIETEAAATENTGFENTETEAVETEVVETEVVETETSKIQATETEDTQTEAAEMGNSEKQEAKTDIYSVLTDCLTTIYGVQVGAAGSSLRAESAADELIQFAKNYGEAYSSDDFERMTEKWLEQMGKEEIEADFFECLESTIAVAIEKDASLENKKAFTNIVDGVRAALQ